MNEQIVSMMALDEFWKSSVSASAPMPQTRVPPTVGPGWVGVAGTFVGAGGWVAAGFVGTAVGAGGWVEAGGFVGAAVGVGVAPQPASTTAIAASTDTAIITFRRRGIVLSSIVVNRWRNSEQKWTADQGLTVTPFPVSGAAQALAALVRAVIRGNQVTGAPALARSLAWGEQLPRLDVGVVEKTHVTWVCEKAAPLTLELTAKTTLDIDRESVFGLSLAEAVA